MGTALKRNRHKKFDIEHGSGNVFKDIGFDDDEAESLLVRAQLMSALKDLIGTGGLSNHQIAKMIGVQQPRIAEITSMKTHLFSTDLLMRLLNRFGKRVSVVVEDRRKAAYLSRNKRRIVSAVYWH